MAGLAVQVGFTGYAARHYGSTVTSPTLPCTGRMFTGVMDSLVSSVGAVSASRLSVIRPHRHQGTTEREGGERPRMVGGQLT